MSFWRWTLSLVCFVTVLGLVGSGLTLAGGDKDKKDAAKKDDAKDKAATDKDATDKDKGATDKGAKDGAKKDAPEKDAADKDKKVADKDKDGKDKGEPAKGGDYVWKAFDRKEPYFQKLETTTNQELSVMEQKIKQTQKQVFYVQWTPKEKTKDGNWIVEQKILGMEMAIDIGGNKITYNSQDEKIATNPMSDFFNNLKNATLVYTISPKMEIEKVEGGEALINKLSTTNPQMKTLLQTLLSEDALKQMAQPTWGAFPPADRKGGAWTKTVKLNLGNIGSYDSTLNYTIKDKNTIDIASKLTYAPPQEKGKSGPRLPFTIKDAPDLAKMQASGSGAATWDADKGWFSKVDMKTGIKDLKLTIEVGSVDTQVTINQDQTSTITTQEKNFIAEKK